MIGFELDPLGSAETLCHNPCQLINPRKDVLFWSVRHSSMVLSATSILQLWVWIPSTPSMRFNTCDFFQPIRLLYLAKPINAILKFAFDIDSSFSKIVFSFSFFLMSIDRRTNVEVRLSVSTQMPIPFKPKRTICMTMMSSYCCCFCSYSYCFRYCLHFQSKNCGSVTNGNEAVLQRQLSLGIRNTL